MNLVSEPYLVQAARWPNSGRRILAQFDDESVIVYQAYRPAIGHFAVKNGYFGGEFSLNRMSWIKPNFLWMMYRSGWASKEGQEVVLAVRLKRSAFDEILRLAVHSSFVPEIYETEAAWRSAVATRMFGSNGTRITILPALQLSAVRSNLACVAMCWRSMPRNGS
jgi:Domain of unknown function (DUF4291)